MLKKSQIVDNKVFSFRKDGIMQQDIHNYALNKPNPLELPYKRVHDIKINSPWD